MKIPLERLASHRRHTFDLAIKDLSSEELESLKGIMSGGNKRRFKTKLELVKNEIQNRRSMLFLPLFGSG